MKDEHLGLYVVDTTLQECIGEKSTFPEDVRGHLCEAVRAIGADELEGILSIHEAKDGNFDSTVEKKLRLIAPTLQVEANRRISSKTKFDNDLVLRQKNTIVCVEIEKGDTARFEFDILKMQALSGLCKELDPGSTIFGAFVVPTENVVARHISGNARESSFKYLTRLCKLVGQIRPSPLEDILLLGYGRTAPQEKEGNRKVKKEERKLNVVKTEHLVAPDDLTWLDSYPHELLGTIRAALASKCHGVVEKPNHKSRYLSYKKSNANKAAYIYFQRNCLVIDLNLSVDRLEEVEALGLEVKPKNNFQAKNGWLTGLRVPYDTDKQNEVVSLLLEALTKNT